MSDASEPADQLLPGDRGWKHGVFTELRVHGVGNTALPWLLDDPAPKQVAGDELAGFYRSRLDRPLILDPRPENSPPTGPCQDERLGPPSAGPEPGSGQTSTSKVKHWRDGLKWTDVEAYDWGGFNTGGGWKAMWILLIPFTLANVAGWLVAGRNRWGQRWVRLFALGTSLFFVTWLGALVVDLLALHCGWQQACYDRQVWLEPYGWEVFRQSPSARMAFALIVPLAVTWALWYLPGRHSNLKYERQNREAQDAVQKAVSKNDRPAPEKDDNFWLRNPNLWARESEVRFDARLHSASILATLGGCVAWANWWAQKQWFDLVLAIVGAVLLVATALVVMGWSPFAPRDANVTDRRKSLVRWLGWLAILFMTVILATSFIDRGYATIDWSKIAVSPTSEDFSLKAFTSSLKAIDEVRAEATVLANALRDALFTANGFVLVASVFGLASIAVLSTSKSEARRNRRLWGRWGPTVVLLTGLAIAGTFVAGAGLWLEEWLGDRPNEHLAALGVDRSDCLSDLTCLLVPPGNETMADLSGVQATLQSLIANTRDERLLPVLVHMAQTSQPPETVLAQPVIALTSTYDLAALGFLAMFGLIVILAIVLEIRLWVSIQKDAFPVRQALCKLSNEKLTGRKAEEHKAWRKVGVREMRKSPRFTRMHHLFWPPAIFIVAFGLFLLADRVLGEIYGAEFKGAEFAHDWVNARLAWLFTLARWLITVAIGVVATLIYRSYKPEAQESFGGMWDVISFLPRHYHPFGVPSYGVRAVPELAARITDLCKAENGVERRCLVSAHSGGVVISLAAISLLDEDVHPRVSLVTYGSPTGALYGRAYPEYFDPEGLVKVASCLGDGNDGEPDPDKVRWFNLWRLTDWTGGYSFGPARDRFKEYRCSDNGLESPREHTELIRHIERIQFDPACRTLREATDFDPLPVAIGHTDYLHDPKHIGPEDPRYQNARGALLRMMT